MCDLMIVASTIPRTSILCVAPEIHVWKMRSVVLFLLRNFRESDYYYYSGKKFFGEFVIREKFFQDNRFSGTRVRDITCRENVFRGKNYSGKCNSGKKLFGKMCPGKCTGTEI